MTDDAGSAAGGEPPPRFSLGIGSAVAALLVSSPPSSSVRGSPRACGSRRRARRSSSSSSCRCSNALLPPVIAALRLPYTFALGFVLVLLLDAAMLVAAAAIFPDDVHVSSFAAALLATILIAAASTVVSTLVGADDQALSFSVLRRVARRQGVLERGDVPGILFLEIDGLAPPVLRRAMAAAARRPWRAGSPTATRARGVGARPVVADRRQPGRDPARLQRGHPGLPLGREGDGRARRCSAPDDCAAIEARLATGRGLLTGGGASRGNLLSGEADETILTVSRLDAERRSNPGYRAFLANGTTSRGRSSCSATRSGWRSSPRRASAVATSGRAAIAAARTRSSARRCRCSSATSSSSGC